MRCSFTDIYLSTLSMILSFISLSISIAAIAIYCKYQLDELLPNGFIILIIATMACTLVFISGIYVAVKPQKWGRTFLIIILGLFALILGVISIGVITFDDKISANLEDLYKQNQEKEATRNIERWFSCCGYEDPVEQGRCDEVTTRCKGVIESFVKKYAKTVGSIFLVLFILVVGSIFAILFILYKCPPPAVVNEQIQQPINDGEAVFVDEGLPQEPVL